MVERNWNGNVPANFRSHSRRRHARRAIRNLAANYRKSLPLKVIAITGSNGKTSTKDFVAAALGARFRVTKTEGNFNNHVGLPRTILEATAEDEIAVWEIGMNHPGEIAALAQIAAPGCRHHYQRRRRAHRIHGIARSDRAGERRACRSGRAATGLLILNADDPFSRAIAERTQRESHFRRNERGSRFARPTSRQSASGSEFTILEGAHRCRAQLPVPGLHMVQNAMLAVAAGRVFGLSIEDCAAGLASAPLTKARLQIKKIRGVQFIDDSYNANPDSMKAALRTLVELEADGRRIAVLGRNGRARRGIGARPSRSWRSRGGAAASIN